MRTVQMTLDEQLVEAVDRIARKLKTTRSAFTREALREAIVRHNLQQLEQKQRQGISGATPSGGNIPPLRNNQ